MQDWQTFIKLDNASTIDFLTSYASGLATESLISERSVDNLKTSLAAITPQLASTQKSVLPLLAEADPEFISILTARYGVLGFAWNHMRASTRNLLTESCSILAVWADQALKKAELFMNRPYVAQSVVGQSRRELFPSVLCHAAKILHDTASELKLIVHDFSVMRPADILDTTGQQHDSEFRVAIQVGFNGLESETLSYCRAEIKAIRKITLVFDEMAEGIMQIVTGLRENTANIASARLLETECEILAAECQRLSGIRFEVSGNLNVWETRRLGFLYEIFSLNIRMTQVAKLFSESLAPKDKLTGADYLTSDVERAISCKLIQGGTISSRATTAAHDLINYCKVHKTTPMALIPAELKKINSELKADTLEFAATLTNEGLTATPGGSNEKARFLEAAKKIRKALNVAVPFSVPMSSILFALFLNSCGFKTQVVSDLKDPRTEIAFRTSSSEQSILPKLIDRSHGTGKTLQEGTKK